MGLFWLQGAHGAAEWASVLGALIAAAGFVTPFASRAVRRVQSDRAYVDQTVVNRASDDLARALHVQWSDEARKRRLRDPLPMPVHWKQADDELADYRDTVLAPNPNQLGGAVTPSASASDRLSDVPEAYERLPRKRLVVLGPPGSGKSWRFWKTPTIAAYCAAPEPHISSVTLACSNISPPLINDRPIHVRPAS